MLFYYKGNNAKMEDDSDNKNKDHLFFHEESIYEFSKH